MEHNINSAVTIGSAKHPKRVEKLIQYGTAGFRTVHSDLDHVIYRMGLLAVLRSKACKATIGVMITASHNPEEDNGIKLVDPLGEMLEAAWEVYATKLANASDDQLGAALSSIISDANIDVNQTSRVVFARDTRSSSPRLAAALQDGIEAFQSPFTDYGVLTTPQLHYMVRCINTGGRYGTPTEDGYYTKLSAAFVKLYADTSTMVECNRTVRVDGANGVGALKLKEILKHLSTKINIEIHNDASIGKLNHMCGADYVKVQQRAPEGLAVEVGVRCASFDGDADRLVYFYMDKDGKFQLLDGDKIATLIAGYIGELVQLSGVSLHIGVVQTAYANGQSTYYIDNTAKVPVACVPTGVKYLHHRAQKFDVGVYFEANGHGTVLFSDAAQSSIQSVASNDSSVQSARQAAQRLLLIIDLINQTVGDAISDLLLVEVILAARGWSVETWNAAYTDLPNRQVKVKVHDRNVVQTTDAERQTTAPPGLQTAINALVAKYQHARSFVRPSGTEDVVRVYAEADTQAAADLLAYEVGIVVYDMAGGDGPRPVAPH